MLGLNSEGDARTPSADVRQEIVESFLIGGVKMAVLSKKYGVTVGCIKQMVFRYRQNLSIFDEQKAFSVMQPDGKKRRNYDAVIAENNELKRQLRLAMLKIEGYELMGKILRDEHGIEFSKKSVAKQSAGSRKNTQK